jgi:hypothetical protein
MPRLRELNANLKPRRPENIISVSDEVWFRLQNKPKCRWELAEKELKIETLKRKRKND